MSRLDYLVIVEPLSEADGGGYLARAPELPGCMSDGETPEEAVTNVQDAIAAWIESTEEDGQKPPSPGRGLLVSPAYFATIYPRRRTPAAA
jgi:antitoxin HicB